MYSRLNWNGFFSSSVTLKHKMLRISGNNNISNDYLLSGTLSSLDYFKVTSHWRMMSCVLPSAQESSGLKIKQMEDSGEVKSRDLEGKAFPLKTF